MAGGRLQLLEGFGLETAQSRMDLPVGMQRLLAFLALRGPAHRHVVAGTLWPEVSEAQAMASLRTGMWRMNRMVPGVVHTEGARLSMAQTTIVDSREQELFATRLLRDHVDDEHWVNDGLHSLWQGELLPGWYDDWVVFERERLNQLRLHALEHAAALLTRTRHLDTALQLALEAVRAEPLRESATAVLMGVYLAEGNACDAIRQYQVFRDLLERELGLEPSPDLTRLVPRPRRPLTHS
jgi:DNA-binding SARP family transcriptional activator